MPKSAQSYVARIVPFGDPAWQAFTVTPIDESLRPSHPIALPGDPWWPVEEPPLGIWGPTDPRPWNPISGIPGIPGFEPPPLGAGKPVPAQVILAGPSSPIPDAPPVGQKVAKAWVSFGPGTKPAAAWIAPYPSQGPVEPPAPAPAPEAPEAAKAKQHP